MSAAGLGRPWPATQRWWAQCEPCQEPLGTRAAGELSELFGDVALEKDKSIRVHRLRHRVSRDLSTVAGDKLPLLVAYAEGVNTGRNQLRARPWPKGALHHDAVEPAA